MADRFLPVREIVTSTTKAELDAMLTDRINRSVPVEQELLDIANGKRPLPTAEDCRRMAMKLGVPTKHRRNA